MPAPSPDDSFVPIPEAGQKISGLYKSPAAQRITGQAKLNDSAISRFMLLANGLPFKRETFRSQRDNALFSASYSQTLADYFQFPCDDSSAWRRSTAVEFLKDYHGRYDRDDAIEAAQAKVREVHAKRTALRPPPQIDAPSRIDVNPSIELLASISISIHQSNPDAPAPVSLCLSAFPAPFDCHVISLKHVTVALDLNGATANDPSQHLGGKKAYVHPNTDCCIIARGNPGRPIFSVSTSSPPFGRIVPDDEICSLYDLKEGQIVTANLSAYIRDLVVTPTSETKPPKPEQPTDTFSFHDANSRLMGQAAKEAICRRIALLVDLGEVEWFTLASYNCVYSSDPKKSQGGQ